MPQDVMGSKVNRASQGSLARRISLAGIREANLVSRDNPVRAASPDNRGSKQMEIRLAELARRVHPMAVRTVGQLAVRAAELGQAAPVRSIVSGTEAIPEATGHRGAKRNQCLPH